jgi:hypothetical protein
MAEVNPNQQPQADATADAPQLPTTSMPVTGQLQPPATPAPAAPEMQPAAVSTGAPVTSTSPNKHLMAFGARLLGAIAGEPPKSYTVNPQGTMVANPAGPETSGDKVKRILSHALTGLAAPVDPNQKSGLAKGLSGVGAGANAVKEEQIKQDALKRAQAKENFEQQQQTQLRHMEIGKQNALTASIYYENLKRANNLDPHFASNQSLYDAVKASPELGGHATEMSDSMLEQAEKADPMFTQTHILKPLGRAPSLDADGNPVMTQDAQGNPIPATYMRFGVINGTKDGKIAVTPQMAEDFKKYGSMARVAGLENIKAGDEYDLQSLIPAMNKVEEQRKNVLEGWQKADLGWSTDKDGKESPVLINRALPPGDPDSVRSLTVKPLALKQEEDKSKLNRSEEDKNEAEAKDKLASAALTASLIGNGGNRDAIPAYMDAIKQLPASSQAILRNVSPAEQLSLLKVANGDADLNKVFPTRTTKGSGQLDASRATNLVSLLNPSWTQQMYTTKQKASSDFATGEDGKAIASFNQFLVHADDARIGSERLQRTNSPWLNKPINEIKRDGMGQPGVPALMTDIFAARNEWQNFIKNGHAADLADTEAGRQIMSDSSSPAQIQAALMEMGKQAVGRLDQVDSKWRRTWGGHYPGLISNTGREAANNLGLGDLIKQYPSESGAMFGAQPNGSQSGQNQTPNPDVHDFDPDAWSKANPTGDVNAAIAEAKRRGLNIKQVNQ